MISALIGSLIMSVVTIAMLISINITEEAFRKAGRYSLTNEEKNIICNAGYSYEDIEKVNNEIKEGAFLDENL
tara:strand:+ start:204 stop:422 length:219 start_codon:yes stop_codon:yes gene_type:complete